MLDQHGALLVGGQKFQHKLPVQAEGGGRRPQRPKPAQERPRRFVGPCNIPGFVEPQDRIRVQPGKQRRLLEFKKGALQFGGPFLNGLVQARREAPEAVQQRPRQSADRTKPDQEQHEQANLRGPGRPVDSARVESDSHEADRGSGRVPNRGASQQLPRPPGQVEI